MKERQSYIDVRVACLEFTLTPVLLPLTSEFLFRISILRENEFILKKISENMKL